MKLFCAVMIFVAFEWCQGILSGRDYFQEIDEAFFGNGSEATAHCYGRYLLMCNGASEVCTKVYGENKCMKFPCQAFYERFMCTQGYNATFPTENRFNSTEFAFCSGLENYVTAPCNNVTVPEPTILESTARPCSVSDARVCGKRVVSGNDKCQSFPCLTEFNNHNSRNAGNDSAILSSVRYYSYCYNFENLEVGVERPCNAAPVPLITVRTIS